MMGEHRAHAGADNLMDHNPADPVLKSRPRRRG